MAPYPLCKRPRFRARSRCRLAALAGFLLACLRVGPAAAELVINELLPDPLGSDGGHEFVELLNGGPAVVALVGVTLEFANGAVAASWAVRWTGPVGATLGPGQRYLIVDRNWTGPEAWDAEAYLGLQNGPDAIRLARDGATLDLVGYGPLTDPELFEGSPVPVVPGASLARRPDGRDTGDNGADFAAAAPTPGTANFRPYELALAPPEFDPPHLPRPGETLRVGLRATNLGTETLPAGPCRLVWAGGSVPSWWESTQPGASRELGFVIRPLQSGPVPLQFELPLADGSDTLRVAAGTVQVGPAGWRLNEVLPAPLHGQGEWLELAWAGPGPGDLDGCALRDEDGDWVPLPPAPVAAGSLAVVAADSAGLAGWWAANRAAGTPGCPAAAADPVVLTLPTWPSLNNTPPAGRAFADRIRLRGPDGTVLDAVAWGGPGLPDPARGTSLERIGPEPINPGASAWAVCTAQAGSTPGCPNSVTAAGPPASDGPVLVARPALLDRPAGGTSLHLTFALAPDEESWALRVYDLWGQAVRDFGGDERGPGPRDLIWDGRDDRGQPVPVGAYVVWLQTRSPEGLGRRRTTLPVVVR